MLRRRIVDDSPREHEHTTMETIIDVLVTANSTRSRTTPVDPCEEIAIDWFERSFFDGDDLAELYLEEVNR